jgi:hypothetical protein
MLCADASVVDLELADCGLIVGHGFERAVHGMATGATGGDLFVVAGHDVFESVLQDNDLGLPRRELKS